MEYDVIAVISLIVLLLLKEILSAYTGKNSIIKSFLKYSNIAIVLLLLVFVAIVARKVLTVL